MAWEEIVAGAIEGLAGIGFKAYDNYQENQFIATQEEIARQQLALAEKEYYSNVDIMNKNFGLQQQAFDYNKQQAELTRMREDNAFQRRVADTVKAGFSPLATEGVASSTQSPTLTAPQLDPQGVNQATTNRLNAYNSKLQQNNTTQQLRLQNQQLKLAQIETITETLQAVQNLRSQNIVNQKNLQELDWYKVHGYRDTTLNTLLSDILKGINVNGKNLSQLSTDGINFALDKILNNPNNQKNFGTGSSFNFGKKNNTPDIKLKDSNGQQVNVSTFKYNVSAIEKMFQSKNIEKINVKKLRRYADEIGWPGVRYTLPDNATKLSPNTYQELRKSFNKYLEEIDKHNPKLKNTTLDNYIRLWEK